jgi:hypothetical protein
MTAKGVNIFTNIIHYIGYSDFSRKWVIEHKKHYRKKMQCRPGLALGIWICGCSLFYKRELWASKSAGAHSTKSLKISGCKR